jgi:hypothetical protein
MLIRACVFSILYHILECTHTATLIYSFHFNNITFITKFEQMSNIVWTCTAFNDKFWQELRFWCHNLAEFCTACKMWKFWYRPLLYLDRGMNLKRGPCAFCSMQSPKDTISLCDTGWFIPETIHSFIHPSIPSFILSYDRSVASFKAGSPQIAI